MVSGRMHWSRSSWIRSTLFADSAVSVLNDHWCSLSVMRNDSISTGCHATRSFVIVAISAFRACCVFVRIDHPRSLGDPENSSSFCDSNTRCGSCCGSRRFVDLEHRVQPDIRVIYVRSGKRQTPRRTGAFAEQRFVIRRRLRPVLPTTHWQRSELERSR